MGLFSLLFSPKGRINIKGFWQGICIIALLFMLFSYLYLEFKHMLLLALMLVLIYALCMVIIKRMHDRNKPSISLSVIIFPLMCLLISSNYKIGLVKTILLFLGFFIGGYILLELGYFKSINENNKYGKEAQSLTKLW